MRRAPAVVPLFVALVLAGGCTDRAGGAEEGNVPRTVTPATPGTPAAQCRELPAGRVLSVFAAGPCDAALLTDDRGLALWTLAPDAEPSPARGPIPEPCQSGRCNFLGYDGALGPMVLAVVAGPGSEMPAGAWLGLALDGARQELVFFDLWGGVGESVEGDGTDLGASHSLAPFACDGQLGLFAVGRLPAAVGHRPPPALLAQEGVYTWDATEPKQTTARRDACVAVAIELP